MYDGVYAGLGSTINVEKYRKNPHLMIAFLQQCALFIQ